MGASKDIPKALADAGYNNIVPTGQKSYNRQVADIQDRYGNSASTFVVKTGLVEPDSHTSTQDLTARAAVNAFSFLAPKLAQQDSAIAAGMLARQEREDRAASLNKPLYLPKIDVFNEQQYAGFKRSIGNQAVQAEEKEIADIQRHLQEPDLSPDLRASLEKRLEKSRQAIVAASTTPDFVGGVMVRSDDRTIMNQANDQLTTSFKNGLYDIVKGVGGLTEMIGDKADINSLVTSLAGEPVNAPSVKLNDLPSEETFRWGKLLEPGRLLRQLAHTAIPSIVDENGNFKTNLAHLKAVIGGYGILPGDHASGSYQRQLGEWSGNNLTLPDGTQAFIPNNKDTLASMLKTNVTVANQMVMDAWTNYWSQGLDLPQNTDNDYTLQLWKESLDITRNKMYAAASDAGVPLDRISNSNALFESSKIIPDQLVGNKNLVIDEMVAQGADPREAGLAVTNLISGNKSKASMARDYMATYGVFGNPNLKHIFESNIFDNIEHAKEQLATSIMRNKYIGKDGEIIGKLLIKAQQAGEFKDDAEFKKTVSEVKAWVDIMNGDFHSLRDFPNLQKISNFLTTATMLASLGKAALSSQVEVAMATLGTPAVLIKKQIDTYFKEYGAEIASDLNKGSSWATSVLGISMMRNTADAKLNNKLDRLYEEATSPKTKDSRLKEIETEISDLHQRLFGRSIFHRAGFAETGFDAANKFEYQDSIGSTSRKMMGRYASLITLRAQTDANRMAVISVAGDIMGGQLRILSLVDPDIRQNAFSSGRGLTKEQQQALTELQQYGIDVHSTLEMLDKAPQLMPFDSSFTDADVSNSPELKRLQDHVFTALGNFVDARVVNPQPHNTPKIYNDPRWKAITLMGKFMATAHAVILPRLYKQYLLEGNAGMKYSAFATIAGALVVASLMNTLKDFLSYDEDRDNPFLKTSAKKAQRTVNASGLIGQFEKITDKISPVIPNSGPKFTNDPVGWGVDKIKDNSPVASWTAKAVGGTSELLAGNTEKGVKQLVRATPVIGSFPRLAKDFVSAFKENNER